MSEALAAWNGYAFDVPGGSRADARYPGAELDLRRLLYARWLRSQASEMVGPPGFEPGSNRPKRSSIGQTNPRARSPTHRNERHECY